MNRTEAFHEVRAVLARHGVFSLADFDKLQRNWVDNPHLLPAVFIGTDGDCVFSLRSLRFMGFGCAFHECHAARERTLNAVREWWLADQATWADATPPVPEAPPPEESPPENPYDLSQLTQEKARAALGLPPLTPEQPARKEPPALASSQFPITFKLPTEAFQEFRKSMAELAARLQREEIAAAINAPAPIAAPKKKGALTTMAKRTVTGTIKKNALKAAQRTAAKAVKDAGREPLIALLTASNNPLAQEAARLLESPHGDAALSVLIGVIATIALPEKVTGNAHVEALLDNLQTDGLEHFTTVAFQVVASPMVSAVSGALMAYGTKMAELEGAVHKLGPGSEE